MTNKRGGARPGAGRKNLYGEPLKPIMVRLPVSVFEIVRQNGGAPWARSVIIQAAKDKPKK